MTRLLKFRAWNNHKRKMLPVFSINFENTSKKHPERKYVIRHGSTRKDWDDDVVVMEFTGLLDKSGKEIYEGDVVKLSERYELREVIFEEGTFGWKSLVFPIITPFCTVDLTDTEVIGNIYENPELLK